MLIAVDNLLVHLKVSKEAGVHLLQTCGTRFGLIQFNRNPDGGVRAYGPRAVSDFTDVSYRRNRNAWGLQDAGSDP